MKPTLKAAFVALVTASTLAFAQGSAERTADSLERRLQQSEQAIAALKARLSSLEAKFAGGDRGAMMGGGGMMGGMMGGGMMDCGGMMGGGRPNG